MNLPGYTYDPQTKRYFKNPPASSNFQNLNSINTFSKSQVNQSKQLELEKKIDHNVSIISQSEINDKRRLKYNSKFSAYDMLIATKFTRNLFKFKRNIFLESMRTPQGNRLLKPYCNNLIACPAKDLLFGSWVNETGDCVVQLDVKELLRKNPLNYKLMARNLVNIHINSIVEQLHPVLPIGNLNLRNSEYNEIISNTPIVLFSIIRKISTFNETSNLGIYHQMDLNTNDPLINLDFLRPEYSVLEFDSLFFCCDSYLNQSLVLGGENKCCLFTMSNENFTINVAQSGQFNLKNKSIVKSIKFSKDGQFFYSGTNKGEIHLVNVSNSNNSATFKLKCGPIVDIKILDENELIVSGHNNYLSKLDVRFFKSNSKEPYILVFKEHLNTGSKIKLSIDSNFQTLISPGDDNSIRIWSIKTGELIRIINFKSEIVEPIRKKSFSDDYLLDEFYNQVFRQNEVESHSKIPAQTISNRLSSPNQLANVETTSRNSGNDQQLNIFPNLDYYFDDRDRKQYHVVFSSNWRCLKKEKRPFMIGSISDSVDFFY